MSPPSKTCPNCGHWMVCVDDEPMGREYWCGFCDHKKSFKFDGGNRDDL